eukprot:3220992-Pyramimonas_sp.AAC.1
MHRLFRCPAHCGLRRHRDLQELQERAAEPGADLLFLTRGLAVPPRGKVATASPARACEVGQ